MEEGGEEMNKENGFLQISRKGLFAVIVSIVLMSCGAGTVEVPVLYRVNEQDIGRSDEVYIFDLPRAHVSRVIDGDTIEVTFDVSIERLKPSERVRFLGVDTPETVHPDNEIQQFGKEASEYTKIILHNQPVYLAFDWDLRDQYGRLLAYIYTEDGLCFNADLIRNGYAKAYTYFPFQFEEEFAELERLAKEAGMGLWQFETRTYRGFLSESVY
jgi:micrococcal nuclease